MRPRHVWSGTSGRQRRLRARATTHIAYLIMVTLCLAFRHVDCNTGEAGFQVPYAPSEVTFGRRYGLTASRPRHLVSNTPSAVAWFVPRIRLPSIYSDMMSFVLSHA